MTKKMLLLHGFVFVSIFFAVKNFNIFTNYFTFASGNTYFVDCSLGQDSNQGTSEGTAWKSLTRVTAATLQAGDAVKLKKGCTFSDNMVLNESGSATSPILITSYGEGLAPTIQSNSTGKMPVDIYGSYIVVDGLALRGVASSFVSGCANNPIGEIWGVGMRPSAAHNVVKNSTFTGLSSGVYIETGSHHHSIVYNQFTNNTMMKTLDTTPYNDAGAFGVEVKGDDNEVAYNTFSGHKACSFDYVQDGSAVEIFDASRNYVHHNKATNNDTFAELGNWQKVSTDNVFAYNLVYDALTKTSFLVQPGNVIGTRMFNNTAYFTGSNATAVACYSACTYNSLISRNNIFWSNHSVSWVDGQGYNEANNIYWSASGNPGLTPSTIAASSKKANPNFMDAAGLNFALRAGSVAINAGSNDVSLAPRTDFQGVTLPVDGVYDIGAFEYTTAPIPSPSPTPSSVPLPSASPATVTNLPPTITSTGFSSGRVGRSYSATVVAQDPDLSDTLDVVISSLPSGLSQGSCSASVSKRINKLEIKCSITGTPSQSGQFKVMVTVADKQGATDTKELDLSIR
jgi:hypothetical protein